MEATTVDRILIELKPFGRVQIMFLVSSGYIQFFMPMTGQSINFLAAIPNHHCALNDGYSLNQSIPIEEDENGNPMFSQCLEYSNPDITNSTRKCQHGWEYDTDVYGETIISEWDLVCDQNAVAEVSQSLLQVGGLLGAFIFGIVADRYGRRPSFLLSVFLYVLFGTLICFSPNYITFVILRFFCGFSQMAIWVCFSSNISEYMVPKYRNRAMIVPAMTFSFGLMFMSLLAFLIRDWRYFQLAIISPLGIGLCGMWFLPESLRWLISKGDTNKIKHLIKKLARQNGSALPNIIYDAKKPEPDDIIFTVTKTVEGQIDSKQENVIYLNLSDMQKGRTAVSVTSDDVTMGSSNISGEHNSDGLPQEEKENVEERETKAGSEPQKGGQSYFDLFKSPVLHITIVISILRLSRTMVYFGFALSTGRLDGNPYLNFFYSALVEVPARFLAPLVYKWIRRTYAISICFFACGASLIMIIFIPTETKNGVNLSTLRNVLSFTGKFFVVLTLAGMLLLVMELFPTTMRNMGNGWTLCMGRLGAILAPLMLYMDDVIPNFSTIVMATMSVVTAFIVLTLPDTRKTTQPQNVDDLREIMNSRRKQKDRQGHTNEAFQP